MGESITCIAIVLSRKRGLIEEWVGRCIMVDSTRRRVLNNVWLIDPPTTSRFWSTEAIITPY